MHLTCLRCLVKFIRCYHFIISQHNLLHSCDRHYLYQGQSSFAVHRTWGSGPPHWCAPPPPRSILAHSTASTGHKLFFFFHVNALNSVYCAPPQNVSSCTHYTYGAGENLQDIDRPPWWNGPWALCMRIPQLSLLIPFWTTPKVNNLNFIWNFSIQQFYLLQVKGFCCFLFSWMLLACLVREGPFFTWFACRLFVRRIPAGWVSMRPATVCLAKRHTIRATNKKGQEKKQELCLTCSSRQWTSIASSSVAFPRDSRERDTTFQHTHALLHGRTHNKMSRCWQRDPPFVLSSLDLMIRT